MMIISRLRAEELISSLIATCTLRRISILAVNARPEFNDLSSFDADYLHLRREADAKSAVTRLIRCRAESRARAAIRQRAALRRRDSLRQLLDGGALDTLASFSRRCSDAAAMMIN
jgi:hypothetical protein